MRASRRRCRLHPDSWPGSALPARTRAATAYSASTHVSTQHDRDARCDARCGGARGIEAARAGAGAPPRRSCSTGPPRRRATPRTPRATAERAANMRCCESVTGGGMARAASPRCSWRRRPATSRTPSCTSRSERIDRAQVHGQSQSISRSRYLRGWREVSSGSGAISRPLLSKFKVGA